MKFATDVMARVAITGMTKSSNFPGQLWLAPPPFTSSKPGAVQNQAQPLGD